MGSNQQFQDLADRIASASNRLEEIDRLKKQLSIPFVEYLNRTSLEVAQANYFEQALLINDWALRCLTHLNDPLMRAHTLFNRGQYAGAAGSLHEGQKALEEAQALYKQHGSLGDSLDCAGLLMKILQQSGKTDEAIRVAQQTLDQSGLLTAEGEISGEIQPGLRKIAQVLRNQGETRLSRDCYEILLQMGEQFNDAELQAESCAVLAEILSSESNFAEAIDFCRKALDLDRATNRVTDECIGLANLGHLHYRLGQLEKSAEFFHESVALREKNRFFDGMDRDLYCYYHVCHYLGEKSKALEIFSKYNELTSPVRKFRISFRSLQYPVKLDAKGNDLPEFR